MKSLVFFFVVALSVLSVKGQVVAKPNIIIFYADDLGWQDTQLNDEGAMVPWETPNMLSLAAEGANFSQAYSPAPTCAPSRTAMMSGHHTTQTKMTHVAGGQIPEVDSNNSRNKLIHPYYPGRLNVEETTIAEALATQGYKSGHVGKWHMAASHNRFPEAVDQGFDFQFTGRGIATGMGDRTTGYATDAEGDPYQIDEDGRPYDAVTANALTFLEDNKSEPFFLYMATWLVHTPIQTRDLALLEYYCNKLGIPVPTVDEAIKTPGQTNPYYGAMVASLDWSLGKIVDYLKTTDDPRNPGKKLYETTYIIFSSDNGGAETHSGEIITDNYPLDKGKKYAQEGGVRVPMVVTGPDIPVNNFDNVVSHLDFFPTILSLTGTTVNTNVSEALAGVDLSAILKGTSAIVEDTNGNERTDLFWHFPHNQDSQMQSSIRSNEFKLYKNHLDGSYEVYQLYNADGSTNDLEEATNVINFIPEATKNELISKLESFLTTNNARYPQWNANYSGSDAPLLNQDKVPAVSSITFDQDNYMATATVTAASGQAAIATANVLYIVDEDEEWFETSATVNGNVITANVPESAIQVVFTLVDENNFLIVSDKISTVPVTQISLNDTDLEQSFNPSDTFLELLGDASPKTLYIQSKAVDSGAKFLVKSGSNTSVVCDKVTFRGRSQINDAVSFDMTIGEETKSFDYASTSSTYDMDFNFDTPITFTNVAQEMNYIITSFSNSDANTPRFRIYEITFHVNEFLAIDDVETDERALKVIPNPVKNIFSLATAVESGVLYSMLGEKVYEFRNRHEAIDISHIESGVYLLYVTHENGRRQSLKLVKE
ncbi:sulfatase-like hydrolase/transferase [Flavicella sediminum]|uniref:sulfatase-like hydrolase/transferase n=1 Tax=Flavicella sediminum TaxID=2585141 RepID=UPI00140D6B44|nr:sulfatase-like hydrolase/transferase [Flavicella sediminum]